MGDHHRHKPKTTEILGKGLQFNLEHDYCVGCVISDHSSFIVTGGLTSSRFLDNVVRYNMMGFVENLPSLSKPRGDHGCGFFFNQLNTKVYVVAGGNPGLLSSTELLTEGDTSWKSGESLPRVVSFVPASVQMDTYFLIIGGYDGNINRGEVLKFNGSWNEVGMMKTARHYLAATKFMINPSHQLDISGCH